MQLAAWMLLSEFVPHVTFMDFTYLEEAWQCAVVQSAETDPSRCSTLYYVVEERILHIVKLQ